LSEALPQESRAQDQDIEPTQRVAAAHKLERGSYK
jgi:hypothetical protein